MVIFYHSLYTYQLTFCNQTFPCNSKVFYVYHQGPMDANTIVLLFSLFCLLLLLFQFWLIRAPSSWLLCPSDMFLFFKTSFLSGIIECSKFTLHFLFCSALESVISPRSHDSFQWRMGFRNHIATEVSLLLGLFNEQNLYHYNTNIYICIYNIQVYIYNNISVYIIIYTS